MKNDLTPHETGPDTAPDTPVAPAAPTDESVAPGSDGTKKAKRKKRRLWRHKDVNSGQASFAQGLNINKIIWVFILGCVIGVIVESLFVFFTTGQWDNRAGHGMLYGPFNQIYGLGAVLFTLLLYRFRKKNAFIIFLISAVVGAVFEYVCSWVQQVAFGSVSWEYSDMPTNIGGRTNLFYAIGWGLLGLLFITHFWPWLSEMIERIPNEMRIKTFLRKDIFTISGKALTLIFAFILMANLALTGAAVFRAGRRNEGVPATNIVDEVLDATYPNEVMAERFPSMQFVDRFGKNNSDLSQTDDSDTGSTTSDGSDSQQRDGSS